ncbi:MAG: quinol:electron acceptor oxidoreductase subunit ActD [Phycisphaerae bacterium]
MSTVAAPTTPQSHGHGHPKQRPAGTRLQSVLLEFDAEEKLRAAAMRVRDAGYELWDVHSPYPVHGIDGAMGIRRTRLPWIVFFAGMTGTITGLLLTWFTNAVDYKIIVGGKPFWSLPAFIPVIFELTILFASFGAVFGMLGLNGLPALYNALFGSPRFKRVTDDRYFISIEASDPRFSAATTMRFVETLGATAIEKIEESLAPSAPPAWLGRAAVIAACLGLIPLAVIARARVAKSSAQPIHIIQDMDNQEKFKAQKANAMFADGRASRQPVENTVARAVTLPGLQRLLPGDRDDDMHYFHGYKRGVDEKGQPTVVYFDDFPVHRKEIAPDGKITEDLVRRGQARFAIYCAPCHGLTGEGNGRVHQRAQELVETTWVQPSNLNDDERRTRPVGNIFNTITNGNRTMPAYGPTIPVADRWAIVAYVRALQRSQSATPAELSADERARLEQR